MDLGMEYVGGRGGGRVLWLGKDIVEDVLL